MSFKTKIDRRKQTQQVLDHLREKGSITNMEALINFGIMRLAARIEELRKDGYIIDTVVKADGKGSRYARYYPVLRHDGSLNRVDPRGIDGRYQRDARLECSVYRDEPPSPRNYGFCSAA